ncbi:MAG: hypothetical protein ACKV1O_28445 [Saprospiraceae bacterium]
MEKINLMKNLLRKMRVGLVTPDDVRRGFEGILEKSAAFIIEMQLFQTELRRYDWESYIEYQNAIIKSKKAIEQNKRQGFEDAIQFVAKAKALRKKINKLIEVLKLLNQAREHFKLLEMNLNSLWVQKMPSVVLLDKSIKDADMLIEAGKLLEAKAIVNSCITDIQELDGSTMLEKEGEDEQKTRLGRLENICRETLEWTYFCPNQPQLEVAGKVNVLLEQCIEKRQIKLVRRLTDDLEFHLKSRILFHTIIKDVPIIDEKLSGKLIGAIKKQGWEGGINCLLLHQTKMFASTIEVT